MDENNKQETLLPGATTESAEEIQKRGFWASIPNKKQFIAGVAIYLVGLVLALVGSSTQMLALDAKATVTEVALTNPAENIYTIQYVFDTEKGQEIHDQYNYWTVTPDKDLRKTGDVIDVKYMPFFPTTDGTESFYPIVMFIGILMFFGGWTMAKGRAPLLQTRKLNKEKEQQERASKYYYPPEETKISELPPTAETSRDTESKSEDQE